MNLTSRQWVMLQQALLAYHDQVMDRTDCWDTDTDGAPPDIDEVCELAKCVSEQIVIAE
jgi:hypothetical protein